MLVLQLPVIVVTALGRCISGYPTTYMQCKKMAQTS